MQRVKITGGHDAALFRPVVDVRSGWSGSWTQQVPWPDGNEGPPVFANAVNDFLRPLDGFIPVETVVPVSDTVTDVWLTPILNPIVLPGGEAATIEVDGVAFRGCSATPGNVERVTCTSNGCTY